jgi:peptidoglycan-associated lipoprotein
MIKRSLWILALTAALAACSSGVKLNDVPVEDKAASANDSTPQITVTSQSTVAPVVSSNAGTFKVLRQLASMWCTLITTASL